MPGLGPGIHVLVTKQDVDGRAKPGHDVEMIMCKPTEKCVTISIIKPG
jgi:hypothetical protein